MFLEKEELKTKTLSEVIEIITRYDDDTINEIINQEVEVFKDALVNYDVETIFSKTGAERNKTLLKHIKACVVFEIFSIRSHAYNEVVKLSHDEAMNWLEKVSSRKMNTGLPIKTESNETTGGSSDGFYKLGSKKSYKNDW